jgi:hypothetical protein
MDATWMCANSHADSQGARLARLGQALDEIIDRGAVNGDITTSTSAFTCLKELLH